MPQVDALAAALAMLERPQATKLAQTSRLPEGVTFLLELAAGEAQALGRASQLTGRSPITLQSAAGFFIEQVLLHPGGDAYRVLGSDPGTSLSELRRNMALLMRWLHPDIVSPSSSSRLSRSLFASRITEAWERIKTEERRLAYDTSLASQGRRHEREIDTRSMAKKVKRARLVHTGTRASNSRKQLVMQRVESESFWKRLRLLLRRGR